MLYLKELKPTEVSKSYLKWMNDREIQKFTEQRFKKHTLKSIIDYVKEKKKSKSEFLYGIFIKHNKHIGNIKLGPINFFHKRSDISYFIGEKKYWGKGYGTEAIAKIIKIARKKGLKKLQAGFYHLNYGSKKVLIKNKFKLEGTLKSQTLFKKKRYKSYLYGLIL